MVLHRFLNLAYTYSYKLYDLLTFLKLYISVKLLYIQIQQCLMKIYPYSITPFESFDLILDLVGGDLRNLPFYPVRVPRPGLETRNPNNDWLMVGNEDTNSCLSEIFWKSIIKFTLNNANNQVTWMSRMKTAKNKYDKLTTPLFYVVWRRLPFEFRSMVIA